MSADQKQYRISPIDFGDGDGLVARVRRAIRNPSLLTFIVMALVVLAIPVLIVAPGFYSGARENLPYFDSEFRVRLFELRVAVPSNIVPYLRQRMEIMRNADEPTEWNAVSPTSGPCNAGNLAELPEGKYTDAIAVACEGIYGVQTEYTDSCSAADACAPPAEAIAKIDAIEDALLAEFIDAYSYLSTENEEGSDP